MTAPFFPAICELAPPAVTQPGAGRSITNAGILNTVCPSSLGGRFAGVAVSPRRPGTKPERAGVCAQSSLSTGRAVAGAARSFSPLSADAAGRYARVTDRGHVRRATSTALHLPSAVNIIGDDGRGSLALRQDPAFAAALDPSRAVAPDRSRQRLAAPPAGGAETRTGQLLPFIATPTAPGHAPGGFWALSA